MRNRSNYLVDRPFQLRATALIIGLTLLIGAPLGFLLLRTCSYAVGIGREAVEMGVLANAASKDAVKQAELLNTRLDMETMLRFGDKPDLLAQMKKANAVETERLRVQNEATLAEGTKLSAQRDLLEAIRQKLAFGVIGGISALVLLVGVAGIYFTHRVAGPIHRMRALFRDVGEGKFTPYRPLRQRDELQDFFAEFSQMVVRLKERQKEEIDHLTEAIEKASNAGVSDGSLAGLRVVRDQMKKAVELAPVSTRIVVTDVPQK